MSISLSFVSLQDWTEAPPHAGATAPLVMPLGAATLGFTGRIHAVDASACPGVPAPAELEHRLLELGFVEGATVEIRHQGLFRRDPIAIRVNGATIALRRREACAIHVRSIATDAPGARR
jgi:ferrous iron transport protein A